MNYTSGVQNGAPPLFFPLLKIMLPDVCICKAMEMQQSLENAQNWLILILSSF